MKCEEGHFDYIIPSNKLLTESNRPHLVWPLHYTSKQTLEDSECVPIRQVIDCVPAICLGDYRHRSLHYYGPLICWAPALLSSTSMILLLYLSFA